MFVVMRCISQGMAKHPPGEKGNSKFMELAKNYQNRTRFDKVIVKIKSTIFIGPQCILQINWQLKQVFFMVITVCCMYLDWSLQVSHKTQLAPSDQHLEMAANSK